MKKVSRAGQSNKHRDRERTKRREKEETNKTIVLGATSQQPLAVFVKISRFVLYMWAISGISGSSR